MSIRYKDWAPTAFDSKGAFLEERDEWFVAPVIQTRDSEPLEESNFAAAEKMLDEKGIEYENHRFGHWGPGWFEILLVSPSEEGEKFVEELQQRLEDYPVLDEDDFSEREWEEAEETWTHCCNLKDRVELIQEHNRRSPDYPVSIFAARHEWIPRGESGYIFERLASR